MNSVRIMAAEQPTSILLCALAPEAMIGWVKPLSEEAKPFLRRDVRDLPSGGRLSRSYGAADVERINAPKPDLIVDFAS